MVETGTVSSYKGISGKRWSRFSLTRLLERLGSHPYRMELATCGQLTPIFVFVHEIERKRTSRMRGSNLYKILRAKIKTLHVHVVTKSDNNYS